ncbi:hypothetical protein [Micromonospora sp. NPDC050695]|uniref:hypothetical protein n=1 Tax=Micromonospora sp. NPDC050695 TaxID=3154938 RepID=UPI0034027348
MADTPCFFCGQGEPDHVNGQCATYRPNSPELAASLTAMLAESVANADRAEAPDSIDGLRARAAEAAYNAEAVNARWTAVLNDDIGGWAVSINGLGPLDGGRMAADLVMTRELAEHIADVHNQWLARQNMGVPVATGFITTPRPQKPVPWEWLGLFTLVAVLVLIVMLAAGE